MKLAFGQIFISAVESQFRALGAVGQHITTQKGALCYIREWGMEAADKAASLIL